MKNRINYTEASEYVQDVITEHPSLHIIAVTSDSVLAVSPKSKKAHFFYKVNEDMSFHFNLLCECRDYNAAIFQRMINELHLELSTEETATDYYNTLNGKITKN